jgi:hypothetical protein
MAERSVLAGLCLAVMPPAAFALNGPATTTIDGGALG